MAFIRDSLLITAAMISARALAAPTTACSVPNGAYGHLEFSEYVAVSTGQDGTLIVGGKPRLVGLAQCGQPLSTSPKGYTAEYRGYIVDALDQDQCLTATSSNSDATFTFSPCKFDSKGQVQPVQAFGWDWDYARYFNGKNVYYAGQTPGFIDATNPVPFSFEAADGALGTLEAKYNPSSPTTSSHLTLSVVYQSSYPGVDPQISCTTLKSGQLHFENSTYNGPLNARLEADPETSDSFFFEQCISSLMGYDNSGAKRYGRLRLSSDLTDGQYNCLIDQAGISTYPNGTLSASDWIDGFITQECDDADNYIQRSQFFEYDTVSNEVVLIAYTANQTDRPAVFSWYTQLDYDREFNVTQYVWNPHGIGAAFVTPEQLETHPAGTVTLRIFLFLATLTVLLASSALASSFITGFDDNFCRNKNKGSNIRTHSCFQFNAHTLSVNVQTPGSYQFCRLNGCQQCEAAFHLERGACYDNDPANNAGRDFKSLYYIG
ncbi:hypothetical protein IE53DRAFT_371329 [Violaceomyces palustris]|uniref:Uncharacterized protein n=1 Tax=Violaceomyces palustris TaxID=1673888 RepID=A0ACD0NP33_9BASI|nr:hypothetical protein IE53DRAFT_371329 [Violaceomyces palustris]